MYTTSWPTILTPFPPPPPLKQNRRAYLCLSSTILPRMRLWICRRAFGRRMRPAETTFPDLSCPPFVLPFTKIWCSLVPCASPPALRIPQADVPPPSRGRPFSFIINLRPFYLKITMFRIVIPFPPPPTHKVFDWGAMSLPLGSPLFFGPYFLRSHLRTQLRCQTVHVVFTVPPRNPGGPFLKSFSSSLEADPLISEIAQPGASDKYLSIDELFSLCVVRRIFFREFSVVIAGVSQKLSRIVSLLFTNADVTVFNCSPERLARPPVIEPSHPFPQRLASPLGPGARVPLS